MESTHTREPWNKGKLIGQKPPLKPKDIWAIRIQLQNAHQVRDQAMFNLAIDSKLRGCDLVNLRVRDITHGDQVLARAMIVQRKTQRPVQFELTEPARAAVAAWIEKAKLKPEQYLFLSRLAKSSHVSTRQYARIVHQWVAAIGLDSTVYGTHTMRRTKATLIYKRTKNLRAVQILLGHTKLESTVRYLGIEVDDALGDLGADRDLAIGAPAARLASRRASCGRFEAWRPMRTFGHDRPIAVTLRLSPIDSQPALFRP